MHPLLNIAVRAARRAGEVIARSIPRLEGIEIHAKDRHDYVTEVDRLAEQEIIGIIRHHYPAHAILAEESGAQGESGETRWIIDPLDGTTNFLHGIPMFAISIGLEREGQIVAGLKPGREKEDETIIFWHRGLSLSDIALAHAMIEKGERLGIGQKLRFA